MRKTIIVMAVLLFVSSMIFGQFISGNKLYEYFLSYDLQNQGRVGTEEEMLKRFNDTSFAQGYISGVFDYFSASDKLTDIPSNVSLGQVMDVVSKYLKENPENRHLPGAMLIHMALTKAWPKKKEPNNNGGRSKDEIK